MDMTAQTDHQIHVLLRERWSPRAFSDQPVEREKLLSILEAARWAPSSFNEQPWGYIVATKENPEEYDKLLSCLVEFNQSWAKLAPVLMLSLAKQKFDKNGKPNRVYRHDVGAASMSLSIQATAEGLFVHQMAGIEPDKARDVYNIPEDWDVVAGVALGYPGPLSRLPNEKLREREQQPRERKPLSDFVFEGKFGEKASLL